MLEILHLPSINGTVCVRAAYNFPILIQRPSQLSHTGITNEADEARDAPNYVPRVFSTATHYGSIYTNSRFILIAIQSFIPSSGQSAPKRRSRTQHSASSLPGGKSHQVEIIITFSYLKGKKSKITIFFTLPHT